MQYIIVEKYATPGERDIVSFDTIRQAQNWLIAFDDYAELEERNIEIVRLDPDGERRHYRAPYPQEHI